MNRFKLFALENRVIAKQKCFDNIDTTRDYDIDIRKSMIIPMSNVSKKIAANTKENDKLLEVGCSTGLLSLMLGGIAPSCNIVGIENNDNMLQVADENACLASIVNSSAVVDFKYAQMEEIPFPDHSMDIVFSYAKLHTWDDPVKVLQEMKRVCKEEGLIYICDNARDADEGMISFILQYMSTGQEEFLTELKASYTTSEVQKILEECGMSNWTITQDGVNMVICNKSL